MAALGWKIRGRRGSRSGMAASVVLLGSRQGCCAANGGLGCGGAARGHGGAVLCSHGAGGKRRLGFAGGEGSGWGAELRPGVLK